MRKHLKSYIVIHLEKHYLCSHKSVLGICTLLVSEGKGKETHRQVHC